MGAGLRGGGGASERATLKANAGGATRKGERETLKAERGSSRPVEMAIPRRRFRAGDSAPAIPRLTAAATKALFRAMRNVGIGLVLGVVCALGACKLPVKADKETEAAPAAPATPAAAAAPSAAAPAAATAALPTAATPSAASSANAAAPASGYSTEGLRAIPDNCVAPQVILTAIPRAVFDSEEFTWRFARQVAVANPQFNIPPVELPPPGHIYFKAFEHTPTKGVALVAKCTETKTCLQFAAAYRTVVPTSKPEVLCGNATTLGAEIGNAAVLNFNAAEILQGSLPEKNDVIGQCVRLAACKAERDKKLDGDPAIACQKKPSTFKLNCAAKFPCNAVLSCMGE